MNKEILTTPEQVLSAARYKVCFDLAPYLAMAVQNCIPMWVKGLGSIAISEKMHLLIDPDVWMEWYAKHDMDVLGWVLIHEVNHPLRDHMDRARRMGVQKVNAGVCNACEDAEINDDFPDPKACLPEGFCWTPADLGGQPTGKLWEEYYANLPQNDQGMKYIPGHPALGEGRRPDQTPSESDINNPAPQAGGTCGSGATGHPIPAEPESSGQHPGRSPADVERIRNQVAEAVQQHERDHGRGSVPGGMSRWAGQRLRPPQIPWQQQIRRAARFCVAEARGQIDYKYDRPSRRQSGVGFGVGRPILPRLFAPIPKIAVAVDTSGSMGHDDLLAAMSEVDSIMRQLGAPVDLYTCDAAVHVARRVSNIQEACRALVGGGGTDFRPIFDAIEKKRPHPDILVIFTDGDGPAPAVNPLPRTRILWVILSRSGHGVIPETDRGNPINYGTFIHVPTKAGQEDPT